MKLIITGSLLLVFFLLSSNCVQVQKKIDQKAKEETDLLSVYIGKNVEEVFIDFGQPFTDGLDKKGFRKVTFKSSKLGVKCIRAFSVGSDNQVIGFESSGCY